MVKKAEHSRFFAVYVLTIALRYVDCMWFEKRGSFWIGNFL